MASWAPTNDRLTTTSEPDPDEVGAFALHVWGGFSQMTTHDVDDPANLYHEVRP